eukprot:759711-Prorocentrum_minimum.AAC.1
MLSPSPYTSCLSLASLDMYPAVTRLRVFASGCQGCSSGVVGQSFSGKSGVEGEGAVGVDHPEGLAGDVPGEVDEVRVGDAILGEGRGDGDQVHRLIGDVVNVVECDGGPLAVGVLGDEVDGAGSE